MFDDASSDYRDGDVAALTAALIDLPRAADDAGRIARLRALEELKAAAAAMQAVETAEFVRSQRAEQQAAGVKADRIGTGIAHQVGLALRMSPHWAQRYVGWSIVLTAELPNTLAALAGGLTTEYRAQIIARETMFLSKEHRLQVDAAVGPRLERLGDRAVRAETRKHAYRLDPAGFVARARAAANDRHVGLRPAPDAMARLTALLPVAQAVACYASLTRAADMTTAVGDERGRGQLMADTLVERVTGQSAATDVPVEINLVMTDESLLARDPEPAVIEGYGPVPAGVAREFVTQPRDETPMWIRQLYRSPKTGELVAMHSRRRVFSPGQRHFLRVLDETCTTPWCGAPNRHVDHADPAARGGPTDVANGRGTCAACNYAKEAPGWRTKIIDRGGGREVVTVTPTGHLYVHRSPDPPGAPPTSEFERRAAQFVYRHAA